jgi:hypothetical protein
MGNATKSKPEYKKTPVSAYVIAAVPFLALSFGVLLANRSEPRIWGLPFLLWYLVLWVVATPAFLFVADLLHKHR